ncbi:hypothetical protein BH20ACT5_BH20ACT5_05610 [soil metagenome]
MLSASGTGGGILCVYESDGRVRFREHTDEIDQFAYAEIPSTPGGPANPPARSIVESVDLRLDITAAGPDTVTLVLQATSAGVLRSKATLSGMSLSSVLGSFSLVSSGAVSNGATYSFSRNIKRSGAGIRTNAERSMGPIAGALFSVAGGVLKMNAQVMPMLLRADDAVTLQVRPGGSGPWTTRASAPVSAGSSRHCGWKAGTPAGRGSTGSRYPAAACSPVRCPAEPAGREVRIAAISCAKANHRQLDRETRYLPIFDGEAELGLYTSKNLWFPHEQLTTAIQAHHPDLLVAMGDQLYESSPTAEDLGSAPELDFLYKYLLWLWSFRDIARHTPTLVWWTTTTSTRATSGARAGCRSHPAGSWRREGMTRMPPS